MLRFQNAYAAGTSLMWQTLCRVTPNAKFIINHLTITTLSQGDAKFISNHLAITYVIIFYILYMKCGILLQIYSILFAWQVCTFLMHPTVVRGNHNHQCEGLWRFPVKVYSRSRNHQMTRWIVFSVCTGNCWRWLQLSHLRPTSLQPSQIPRPPPSPKNKYSPRVSGRGCHRRLVPPSLGRTGSL